ncbi:MAG: heat-inducible transcription repressor HrcA [Deltaproteobacteria bacterium]|nr:heat-inducible transcription repressor HrcA [Deltaproteobacteria bacterium]
MSEILSERDKEVLHAVISEYILSAIAVSSRTIAKRYLLDLSPATVRNVMADLEESGYLTHPHTSAGRVPTEKGVRFYIDTLLEKTALTPAEQETINSRGEGSAGNRNEFLREISRLLSLFSHNIGVVLAPKFKDTFFKQIRFIRLNTQTILGIFISEMGMVHHRMLQIEKEISQSDCDRMSNYLNQVLQNLPLREVRIKIIEEMRTEKNLYDQLLGKALKLAQKVLEENTEGEVYVEGQTHLLEQPEFSQDVDKMKEIFHAFEEKGLLVKILDQSLLGENAQILLGSEANIEGMSLVIAPYHTSEQVTGTLGVIGPLRMNYGKVVPLVEYTARLMSRLLGR